VIRLDREQAVSAAVLAMTHAGAVTTIKTWAVMEAEVLTMVPIENLRTVIAVHPTCEAKHSRNCR
jgi:hypothetical protein